MIEYLNKFYFQKDYISIYSFLVEYIENCKKNCNQVYSQKAVHSLDNILENTVEDGSSTVSKGKRKTVYRC